MADQDERSFRVGSIDHVELFVPDREEAANWYRRVLGLEVLAEGAAWAEDPRGPLMISSDEGRTKLALFPAAGHSAGSTASSGVGASVGAFRRVAFRASADEFLHFLKRLGDLDLTDTRGEAVTPDRASDHQSAWSIYFADPWGHALEITTYDYEAVRQGLADGFAGRT